MIRSLRWLPFAFAGLSAAIAVSCSSSSNDDTSTGGSAGAGGSAGHDSGAADAPISPHCNGPLPVMTVSRNQQLVAPDWSCLGQSADAGSDAGDPGSDAGDADAGTQNLFELTDFVSGNAIAGVQVDLFFGNTIVGQQPDFSGTTAGAMGGTDGEGPGQFWFPHPTTAQIAYREHETTGKTKALIEFDDAVGAPPKKLGGNGISQSGFNTLALAAVPIPGWTPPTDHGIVAVAARDCAGNDVEGAVAELVDDATGQVIAAGDGNSDLKYVYFNGGGVPDTTCSYTNSQEALIVMINAPANGDGPASGQSITVQWKGRVTESDADPKVFAKRKAEIFQNAVNVFHLAPR